MFLGQIQQTLMRKYSWKSSGWFEWKIYIEDLLKAWVKNACWKTTSPGFQFCFCMKISILNFIFPQTFWSCLPVYFISILFQAQICDTKSVFRICVPYCMFSFYFQHVSAFAYSPSSLYRLSVLEGFHESGYSLLNSLPMKHFDKIPLATEWLGFSTGEMWFSSVCPPFYTRLLSPWGTVPVMELQIEVALCPTSFYFSLLSFPVIWARLSVSRPLPIIWVY